MTAIEKLRNLATCGGRQDLPAGYALTIGDCAELLQEIDRIRAETREACAQICDERAMGHIEATRADEAESCAAAIRAGGQS